ncbi:hypothetical protein [Actinomadura chibensis]|uniref:Uncharacterized protein n=1 Tax=Actinomadura chibensis TaxID=392828 RepID=A0A5D0NTY4_9ACTN|nr:hypothetical protein [Actinomadura chibensis]TYB47936.1 hypothetical protein FXF69_01445 [Actinomadura chibensis]
MSDFDDLVSAERRRIDARAAAHAARETARRHGELPEWQRVVARVQDLLSAAARHLRDAGVPPVPVLEARKPNQRLELWGLVLAGRVVVVGRRWPLGPFALDAEARAYPAARLQPLLPDYPLSQNPQKNKKLRKARLRTGLAADQQVMWADGNPFVLDPATGVETGRIACFGKGENATPLLLSDDPAAGQPLEPFLAKAVAQYVAQNGRR